jgi:pyruvate kinase
MPGLCNFESSGVKPYIGGDAKTIIRNMIRRRRTKIVCTIGPATESRDTLNRLILRGADVIRLNMSHGTHEWHRDRIRMIRELADETNIPIAIIMDIQGPKIRTGNPGGENIILQAGDALTIHTDPASIDPTGSASGGGGAGHAITVNYPFFDQEVCEGQMILIDDGLIRVQILKAGGGYVEAKVIIGGVLTDRRGVSVPGADFSTPSVTEKDTEDLMFGIGQGIDYIAISFVRTASDVSDLKQVIREQGANVPIIAKIETKKGLENFSEILKVADGIMVARGDLGVEIPIENVPMAQKMLIKESNAAGKPVITATQMLESMIRNATPTRAEVTDVANAILDGTDAIMLSGETTIGKYPIESIAMMDRIAKMTESSSQGRYLRTYADASAASLSIEQGIGHAVCQLAHDLGAAAIITTTYSGSTAGVVSMYRPETPIIAITPDKTTFCRLALVWGVAPLLIPPVTENTDEMVAASIQSAMDAGFVETGDRVVLTAGVPIFSAGTTNLIKAHVVGQQAGVPF